MWFADLQSALEAGLRLYETEQFDALDQLLRAANAQFPEAGRLIELQGLLWSRQKRFAEARQALEQAMSLTPLSFEAQIALADAYRHYGQQADARTMLSYLAGRADLPTAMLPILTAGLGQLGEYQLALEVSREAARREPDRDEALYGMVFYMNKLDYPAECVLPLLRRAVSLAPDCQVYRLGLAWMCARTEQWEEAYEACCGLAYPLIRCQNCFHFVISVFEIVGDHVRRDIWRSELSRRSQSSCPGPPNALAGRTVPRNMDAG